MSSMAQPCGSVEEFLMGELEKRDQEIIVLRKQVVRLQCSLFAAGGGGGAVRHGKKKEALPQILLSPQCAASTSSLESTYGSEILSIPPTPEPEGEGSFKIRVVSPSPPAHTIQPAEIKQSHLLPFLNIMLNFDPISDGIFRFLGDCHPLMRTCTAVFTRAAVYCTVALTAFKAHFTLEPGISNESAYELLDSTIARRRRTMNPKRLGPQQVSVCLNTFVQCKLRPRFNTIAFNVNNPKAYFKQGPPGMRPENNPSVDSRGLNVGVLSTLRSKTQQVDYTNNLAWLQNRNVRLFYPRASVPHMLGMLEAVQKLSIQPTALVMDVCLVKPKWFPGIEYMRQYPNVILVPEIPSKEALDEGEAQRIRVKFNKYLQSFATSGQCIYVVLDQDIAPEVSKEIRTNKVNVLSLPLPDKEGPIGLREYPLLELLTVLDSVFDDDFTLTVPEEREPLTPSTAVFSPAPGAGGVYKYTKRQAFSFHCPKTRGVVEEDEGGVSDSSNYSASSKGSHSSFDRKNSLSDFFKSLSKPGRSRGLTRGQGEHETSPPPRRPSKSGTDQLVEEVTLSVPLSPAEQEASQKIAEEDGFTLSITAADDKTEGTNDFVWHWGKEVPQVSSNGGMRKLLGVDHVVSMQSFELGSAGDVVEHGMHVVGEGVVDTVRKALGNETGHQYTPVTKVMQMCQRATQRKDWCGVVTVGDRGAGEGVAVHRVARAEEYTVVHRGEDGVDVMVVAKAWYDTEGYDTLYLDSLFAHKAIEQGMVVGKTLCMDLTDGSLGDDFAALVAHVDVLFTTEELTRIYSPTPGTPQTAAQGLQSLPGRPRLVLVTLANNNVILASEKGTFMHPFPTICHASSPSRLSRQPFIAGFLARYCTGRDPETCVQHGFRQAAASTRDNYLS